MSRGNVLFDGVVTSDNPFPVDIVDDILDTREQARQTAGGQARVYVHDDKTIQLLTEILTELKKINIHLYSMTDEYIEGEL